MRIVTGCLFAVMTLYGAVSHASDRIHIEKVKTGILPSGGFYSLYEVDCSGQITAAIASLNGQKRWCSLHEGAMNCHSSKQDASVSACMSGVLASTDDNFDVINKY